MTILPKKKHQDSNRKNEQEQDESRNRRHRTSQRNRNHTNTLDELGSSNEGSPSSLNLSPPVRYNELDGLEAQEGSRLPQKRSRHRPSSNFYLPPSNTTVPSGLSVSKSRSTSREGSRSPCESGDDEEEEDGYNSSDEHGERKQNKEASVEMLNERETEFERELREKKGFLIKQMATDGACMFRAVADQVYGDQEMHNVVRRHCMDYMVKNRDFFSQYITEDFTSYIRRKRNEHAHGNHIEMQALSEMYNRSIEVYQYSYEPINTFHSRTYTSDDNAPIRLSYHGNVHYNSVIDPYNPTVGVGLGLAGYKPGSDNKELLRKTMKESESTLLEQEMLEDKIKATDWEATDEELAELAARESYMQWLKDSQKPSGASSSSSSSSQSKTELPPEKHHTKSPAREQSRRSPRNELDPKDSPSRESSNYNRKSPRNELGRRESPVHDQTTNTSSSRRSPRNSDKPSRKSPPRDNNNKSSGPVNKQSKGNSPVNNSFNTVDKNKEDTACSSSKQGACGSTVDWTYTLGYDSDWDNDPVLAAVLAQSQQEYLDSLSKNKPKKSDDT